MHLALSIGSGGMSSELKYFNGLNENLLVLREGRELSNVWKQKVGIMGVACQTGMSFISN